MPISVTCPACAAAFQVKDEYAGKKGKCPKCKAVLTVPSPFHGGDTVRMPTPPIKRPKPKPDGGS
jgi:predicted Zn finger-like uncharacterized protein